MAEIIIPADSLARRVYAIERIDGPKLSGKFVGKVARILDTLRREERTHKATLGDLLREYAEKDDDGNTATDSEGNVLLDSTRAQEYHRKVRDLNNDEITLVGMPTLDEELLDKQPISVLAREALLPFVLAAAVPVAEEDAD